MARKKQENPNQLKLFMTAREIVKDFEPIDGDYLPDESTDELWERKADEAEQNGLMDSIKETGVQIPVSLHPRDQYVVGGHHRIAAQHRLNPDQFIPVNYEIGPGYANYYDYQTQADHKVDLPNFDDSDYHYDTY
jgi:hypothetical protein